MKSFKTVMLTLGAVILTGCAGTGQIAEFQEPNEQLESILSTYGVSPESGVLCQHSSGSNHDCRALASELRTLNASYPEHQEIGLISALVEYQSGRREQAQFVLDLLMANNLEPSVPVYLLRAKIAMDEGNIALARDVIHKGLRHHPGNAEMYNHLAATFYLEGRYERADASLATADKLGLAPWKTNFLLGVLHKERLEYQSACHYFANALNLNAGHKQSIANLIELSRYDECSTTSIF